MEIAQVKNYTDLLNQIAKLKNEKENQEEALKQTVEDFSNSFSISNLFKSGNAKSFGFTKQGLGMATNLLIGLLYKRKRGIKGIIGSIVLKNLSNIIINYKFEDIVKYFSNIFYRKTEPIKS